ncbi:MAG: ketose-bisphosphate aldolase [Oscillospiraceae bacterium]|jgi:fructose-bisphosphate aldolase class II|nr:ketose-bisphosphate aldolase [Oscillospiraceae bacterium]
MPLVDLKTLLLFAEKEKRAVGAFSVGNMEMVLGVIRAAEEAGASVILQIAEKRLAASPLHLMAPMMVSAAQNAAVDVCVHLDHGLSMECIEDALAYGFTSVMLDASLLPFEENVALTNRVCEKARRFGASVEAELGVVGGNEGDTAEHRVTCTDPQKAKEFCEKTGIDALAVAIGNAHGNYPVLPALRFDVLEQIHAAVSTPLVLHGGTGITGAMFQKVIRCGVRKINIATASFDALAQNAKSYCAGAGVPDYFALSAKESDGVYQNVKRHIAIFNQKDV